MSLLASIFAVLTGLAFGSFLNVCISRLPRHQSIVTPRSRCPVCRHPIASRDNVPILSWLLLRGRCRSCQTSIPLRYPMIEGATAALFLLCFLHFGLTFEAIAGAVFCCFLLALAATDAETMLLPDALTLPGIATGVVYSALAASSGSFRPVYWKGAGLSLLAATGGALLILLIRLMYRLLRHREGMGLGDAKLLAMIGAWIGGAKMLLVFFLAVLGASAYGIVAITYQRRKATPPVEKPPMKLPLGAFLCAASIFTLFEGERMLNWYFGLMR